MVSIPLLEAIDLINTSVPEFDGVKKYVATGDLAEEVSSDVELVTYYNKPSRAQLLSQEGDVIFARMKSTVKVHLIDKKLSEYIYSTGFVVARPRKEVYDRYLYHYLKSDVFQIEKDKYCTGATQKAINNQSLSKITIPLPPLPAQKRIAEILDAADALRKKDQELLEKYDELAQAIFVDMFGDPVKNEKGWEVKSIEDIVVKKRNSIKRGPFGGALKKEIFVDDGFLVYEQFHALNNDFSFARYFIDEKKYRELEGFSVEPGDIIISCSGIYLGKLAVVPLGSRPGIINQALLKIKLDQKKYLNSFFVKVFSQKNFKEKYFASERGAAIPNFPPISAFKQFEFITPPIKMQLEFEKYIEIIDSQRKIVEKQLQDRFSIFNALISKAFSG